MRARPRPALACLHLRAAVLVACVGVVAGCGQPAEQPAAPGAGQPAPLVGGLAAGQEVWIPYDPPSDTPTLSPHLRPMEAARALAEGLRQQALSGGDIGRIARRHSGAPSSVGDGLVALPVNAARTDERDRALMDAPMGAVTPLLDWQRGFWFARRIDMAAAQRLKPALDEALRSEVRGQAIVVTHKDAWPWRHDQKRTRERARQMAEAVLSQALAGADFEGLARAASEDQDSAARGGWLWAYDRATGKPSSPWVRWGSPDFPVSVVNGLLRGELGKVVPEVLDTLHGFVIVRPVERRAVR
ncbi:MAG: peptidylprolyl isomerase [Planctomycetia bacterium]